ncbi:hypothetical protein NLI96_g4799 [Meripilus lineatus]|uniref:Uncharacterized protein n=1 Tax=Meripilus lineatus TaxID=2056292 RepID=A0AAD5V9I3_9APHY|nr:hypothetical protein NLI96_g4799 [Physisporinus lineatus]
MVVCVCVRLVFLLGGNLVTPPGQESRLTRALKSYHISKARAPSDLPEWLFEEKERKVPGRLRVVNPSPEDNSPVPPIVLPTPYIPVPAVPPSSQSNSKPSRANSTRSSQASPSPNNESLAPSQPMTRVAQRLQQMREGNTPSTSSTGRVRFKEQIHPRRMASTPNLGEAAKYGGDHGAVPDMPTGFVKPISSQTRTNGDGRSGQAALIVGLGNKVTSNDFPAAQFPAASRLKGPGLAKVDIRGRRPAANGLPTGVKPVRI